MFLFLYNVTLCLILGLEQEREMASNIVGNNEDSTEQVTIYARNKEEGSVDTGLDQSNSVRKFQVTPQVTDSY